MKTKGSVYRVELAVAFDEAVERTIHELSQQGFGVITWIDMKDKLIERLGAEFRSYVIMGVFDPDLAQSALEADLEAGLILASNVVVYENAPRRSVVAALAPKSSFAVLGSAPELEKLALDADVRIRAVIESLEAG